MIEHLNTTTQQYEVIQEGTHHTAVTTPGIERIVMMMMIRHHIVIGNGLTIYVDFIIINIFSDPNQCDIDDALPTSSSQHYTGSCSTSGDSVCH